MNMIRAETEDSGTHAPHDTQATGQLLLTRETRMRTKMPTANNKQMISYNLAAETRVFLRAPFRTVFRQALTPTSLWNHARAFFWDRVSHTHGGGFPLGCNERHRGTDSQTRCLCQMIASKSRKTCSRVSKVKVRPEYARQHAYSNSGLQAIPGASSEGLASVLV